MSAETLRAALQCDRPGCECHRPRGRLHCPHHDPDCTDRSPGLSVTETDGKVLFHCFNGCAQGAVLGALRERGLWSEHEGGGHGLALDELASAKKIPADFLRGLGVRTVRLGEQRAVGIPYHDADGNEAAFRYRLALTGDRFRWKSDARVLPYGLWRLNEARRHGWLLLVEGESDCWTAWHHNLPALGIPGKSTWREEWARHLDGLAVCLWCEPGAEDLVPRIAQDLPHLRVIQAPDGCKDLNEAHVRGENVRVLLARLRVEAVSADHLLARFDEERRRKQAEEALPRAREILEDPNLLERVDRALAALGLAGDRTPARVLFLALISRRFDRPVNIVLEGPSGAGKNFTLDRVLQLFPPSAAYLLTTASERSLVYTEEDMRHRYLVVGEAAGLHRDGIGATILRTIAWEGRLVYETVEKTNAGLRPRRIEKPGPTGVITTTVRALEPELTTRFLSVPIRDDPEQTRQALVETARRAAKGPRTFDLAPFVQAQRWLDTGGASEVVVPYAEVLAELVDASAVRMRRDFSQFLALMQASALLHQRQRPRDRLGRVIAAVADYETVHALAGRLFAEPAGLTEGQREAVAAVRALCVGAVVEVSVRQVADHLGIDKSAASRRLQKPLAEGYIVNLEDHRGRPARLRPGDAPPAPRPVLPDPAELRLAWERVVESPASDCNTATPEPEGRQDAAPDRCSPAMQQGDRCTATPPPVQEGATTPNGLSNGASGPTVAPLQSDAGDSPAPPVSKQVSKQPEGPPPPDGGLIAPEDLEKGGGAGQFTLRVGEALSWRPYLYKPGHSIAEGKAAWLDFVRTHPPAEVARAAAAMMADPALNGGAADA